MKALFVCAILLTVNAWGAPQDLQRIRSQLVKYERVQGTFEQVRVVKDVDLKLVSSGNFDFTQPLDLKWNQKQPFEMSLLMTPDKIVQKSFDGSEQVILKQNQPVIFVFSLSFLSVFSGDEKKIQETFEAKASFQGKQWNIHLRPKDELLKKAISKVEIQGKEFVEKVVITEVSSSSTTIQFANWKGTH